ncbi:MAG TPA: hypothetical protein VL326_24385 [Kofleriaceae bacterium]|jgi:hypothetical protein|nr:hypothetical protein [Kofleriaceae bacterium]
MKKAGFVLAVLLGAASSAAAQPGTPAPSDQSSPPAPPPEQAPAPPPPTTPGPTSTLDSGVGMPSMTTTPGVQKSGAPEEKKKKEPGRGDFDAGGQVRLPNGPDESNQYAAFNWIAVDLKGRYFLLDQVTLNGNIPLAIIHPDTIKGGMVEPKMLGGMTVRLDAIVTAPKLPGVPSKGESKIGLSLTGGYMREGAMLLTDKDFPLFVGDLKPGFAGALVTRVALSTVVDFSLTPAWIVQSGTASSHKAVQVPLALIIKLGSLVKLSTDLNIATGDDYSMRGKNGGRIGAGVALDLKIGPILGHLGTGVASLLTGDPMTTNAAYPSIRDSVYFEVNAKYAK